MNVGNRVQIKNIYNKKEFKALGYDIDDYIGQFGEIAALGSDHLYKYHVHLNNKELDELDWAARELILVSE